MKGATPDPRTDLKGMTVAGLEAFFARLGKEKYRARQVSRWIYQQYAENFSSMTDLSLAYAMHEAGLPKGVPETARALIRRCLEKDLALVGGSLVPHGGQNILEPAAWGLVPLHGPNLQNFRWAEKILAEAGAGITVTDAASLSAAAASLLADPERRRELGTRAQAALTPHRGAARRQAELIAELWRRHGS